VEGLNFNLTHGPTGPEPGRSAATVRKLTGKGVRVEFVTEHLVFTDEDTAVATLMLSMMGAFAEFERSIIRARQREGGVGCGIWRTAAWCRS